MKVYELITALMELPAGMTVRIGGLVSDEELKNAKK